MGHDQAMDERRATWNGAPYHHPPPIEPSCKDRARSEQER